MRGNQNGLGLFPYGLFAVWDYCYINTTYVFPVNSPVCLDSVLVLEVAVAGRRSKWTGLVSLLAVMLLGITITFNLTYVFRVSCPVCPDSVLEWEVAAVEMK